MCAEFYINIKFSGRRDVRDEMISLVDEAFKTSGNINDDIDLSGGLSGLLETHLVHIIDDEDSMSVWSKPSGDSGGKELNFMVHKSTKTVYLLNAETSKDTSADDDIDFLDDI